MPSEKSEPTTSAPREASSIARSPVPVATSSAREPGPTRARSAARSRQRWCSPAVMTEFMRSYGPAMRSNIARTCPSSRVPLRAPALMRGLLAGFVFALELGQERDQVALLLRVELPIGRHRRRRVLERALDRAGQQLVPDVG